jgi:hypothetical protein
MYKLVRASINCQKTKYLSGPFINRVHVPLMYSSGNNQIVRNWCPIYRSFIPSREKRILSYPQCPNRLLGLPINWVRGFLFCSVKGKVVNLTIHFNPCHSYEYMELSLRCCLRLFSSTYVKKRN